MTSINALRDAPVQPQQGFGTWVKSLVSRKAKERTVFDLPIAFHRDTAGKIAHGLLIVTNPEFKLVNQPVRFSFIGCQHAPMMTPDVIYHIWIQARDQGYIAHNLLSYKALD